MKTRRGWYLMDTKTDENDKRIKDEKEDVLEASRAVIVKRGDNKIARRRLQAEQREAALMEELSNAQKAVEAKQQEIEVTHRLAAELSRRKNEEVKHALKHDYIKSFALSPTSCGLKEVQSHLIEEKVRLEANQAELLKHWHEDKIFEKLQQAEDEKKKQSRRKDLQNQLADNQRRVQQRRTEEKEQDRKMIEQAIQKTQEEDAKTREKKKNNAIFFRTEMAAAIAAKKVWERKYKEALKEEDKKIARIIVEKEARHEKQLDTKTELRAAREAAIDNVARELLANVCKEKKKQEIIDELYREEQRNKWMKESVRPVSKRQCDIAESFKEKAERKAKDEAIDAAFVQYLTELQKKDIKKQREDDKARYAKSRSGGEETRKPSDDLFGTA
ncbi:PREDICTED: meiosis-specific nuclear structural protein 1-like [Atta colombica]|uniref:meiosis-specific nuclear structural protein 1-like n=1 Tax=Atta colombica TaxID=520822 RepID=UPI00084BD864|nr:PREDICTED: meiosis-specific nuclear structural protein 1-like [Atta colombica]